MQMNNDKRFAVLIDADNVSDRYIRHIFDELANEGIVTYRRIYGDWTKPALGSWKNVLLNYSITPIQQYSYTTGKNATDSAMIIDAMDILYSHSVEGFCLVSSDSDFTKLASRLKESGMTVIGMGERKTPPPFVNACNKFKYLESISGDALPDSKAHGSEVSGTMSTDDVRNAITGILDAISDEDGWALLSEIGNILVKRCPSFDVRNYGFSKLTPYVKSLNSFEIDSVPSANGSVKYIYIRRKQ